MKRDVFERLHSGMSDEQKKRLNDYNAKQDWRVQCWSCRGFVERKLSELHGPCPHCGSELSRRG